MPDANGLGGLHTLLGQSGTDVPALLLLEPGRATPQVPGRFGTAAILDERAKARHRRRLVDVDGEFDRGARSPRRRSIR